MNRAILPKAVVLALFLCIATPAHANPGPMMSEYLRYVAMPAFLMWLILGVTLIAAHRKIRFISVGTFVFAALAFFLSLYEFVLIFWQIYLGLIVASLYASAAASAIRIGCSISSFTEHS